MSIRCLLATWLAFIVLPLLPAAQTYDLLLKGGHVIDPKNRIDERMDLAIKNGRIARIAGAIPESEARQVVAVDGCLVVPGLIDLHGHHFYGTVPHRLVSNGPYALPPDGFTLRAGVTTVVDAGGAGWSNFALFKRQVIEPSETRVLAFLNIVGDGMTRGGEQNIDDMDPEATARAARANPEIVGVKIAHFRGYNWEPHRRAAAAGVLADMPVMIDLGYSDVPLPLEVLFFNIYRPGDILTHMYGNPRVITGGFKEAPVDEKGVLRPHWLRAQRAGFVFDVGHGRGSFLYAIAAPAIAQGLRPDTISTDLHAGSMNHAMKDMLNVMSKMMQLGMSLAEVVEASTWKPARVIHREELGHLSVGAEADVAVLRLRLGEFGFMDVDERTVPGDRRLEGELTLRAGKVAYDMNGRAGRPWGP